MAFDPKTGEEIDPITGMPIVDANSPLMGQQNEAPALPPQPSTMNPMIKDYISQKYGLGGYNDEARRNLQNEVNPGTGDSIRSAVAALGAGFLGTDPAQAGLAVQKAARENANDKLNQFDKGRQAKLQEYDLNRQAAANERSDDLVKRESDPMSDESKMADELARSMGYKGGPITAKQFKDFSPVMQKKYEIAEKSLDRQERSKDRALQREIALGQKEQARQDKLEQQAKPSEKQVKEFTEFDNALDNIKSIRSEKGKFDTGPLAGRMNAAAGLVGLDDSDKTAFRSQVQDQMAQYIKSISGGAVSDQERASLIQNIPSMNDNDETFNKKLDQLESRLEGHRKNAITNAGKMGKNVKEFERAPNPREETKVINGKQVAKKQYSKSANKTKIIYDDGSEEIVDGKQ